MSISLSGRCYDVVRDMAGAVLVIVQYGPSMWRVASVRDASRVLAGFRAPVLAVIQPKP